MEQRENGGGGRAVCHRADGRCPSSRPPRGGKRKAQALAEATNDGMETVPGRVNKKTKHLEIQGVEDKKKIHKHERSAIKSACIFVRDDKKYPNGLEMTATPMASIWKKFSSMEKLWEDWILVNNITLIGGPSNVGKSPLLCAIVAGYLQGRWPNGEDVPPKLCGGNVLYLAPEGFIEQTEMLQHWGLEAKLFEERVYVPEINLHGDPDYQFKLDQTTLGALDEICTKVKPKLIIIDGLRAVMEGDESSSRDSDALMGPLVKLTRRIGAATVIAHHLNKGCEILSIEGSVPKKDWLRGSTNIVAACRSVWIVDVPNATKPLERRVTLVKTASGAINQQMAFSMGDPRDGLRFISNVPKPELRFRTVKMEEWLLGLMEKHTKLSKAELHQMAGEAGFSTTTLDKLMTKLNGNKIEKALDGKKVFWRLLSPQTVQQEREDDHISNEEEEKTLVNNTPTSGMVI